METSPSAAAAAAAEAEAAKSATLDVRIRRAKRVIRDATASALKFAQIQETDVTYESSETKIHDHDAFDPSASPDPEASIKAMNEAEEFDLAMTLFGDDIRGIEEDFNDKLVLVENDINNYFAHKQQDEQEQHGSAADVQATSDINNESFGIQSNETLDSHSKQQLLEQEAKELHAKISFLQKCSKARFALDEADQYLLQASTGSRKAVMVSCARQLQEATKAVQAARDDFQSQDRKGNINTDMNDRDEKVARSILSSIEDQIRRKVLDLSSKALTMIDSCIVVTSDSISVCEGPVNDPKTGGSSSDGVGNALHDSTNIESSSSSQEQSYEGLKVALNVLATLSTTNGSCQSHDRLAHAMGVIVDQLLLNILRPAIHAVHTALESGSEVTTNYIFEESTAKSMGSASSKLTGMGSGKQVRGMVTTLTWTTSVEKYDIDDKTPTLAWWTALLGFIQNITQFMRDKVLSQGSEDSIRSIFGKSMFGNSVVAKNVYSLPFDSDIMEHGSKCPILKLLGRLVWEHCIPKECNKEILQGLQSIEDVVKESITSFDSFLMESRLINIPTALSEYGDGFEKKYNDKIRTSILGRGRKILLDGDYHNSIQVGVNVHEQKKGDQPEFLDSLGIEQNDMSIFLLEACGISNVASDLMDLCRQTMDSAVDEIVASQTLIPPTLYRTSRELLDLYRATIPAVHGSEIASIPRTAAIFHNDCVFFAHKLLTLGLEYRDRFASESPMRKMCTFLDLVPIFRELAERTMNDMIRHQKRQISEILMPRLEYLRDALGSNEGVVEWTDAETALTAGLYHLRHLSQAWKSMLSHDVYCITMGSIADSLFKIFLDKVLGTKDISVPACHFLNALFQNGLRGVADVFGSPSNTIEGSKIAEKFCALFHKFAAVGKFMNMCLADINMALSEGDFQSVTGAELSKLVVAVFQDSEGRRKLLRLLESS